MRLSDRGVNFLSEFVSEVCQLTGMKKINTTAYHPQTDGMVEKYNSNLLGMNSKHAAQYGSECDRYLCYLLLAYRVKPHESMGESPFFLLHGRDARLPTETALTTPRTPYQVDTDDYTTKLMDGLSTAWKNGRLEV